MHKGLRNRLLFWHRKTDAEPDTVKFAPKLRITRHDDWVYLELLLINSSEWTVWVEEARVMLAHLDAKWQTAFAPGQAVHKIRQDVGPDETLSVSLAATLYDAAGRPQGRYSCSVCVKVRYCIQPDEWYEAQLEEYRVEMRALTVLGLRREHGHDSKAEHIKGPLDHAP